MRVEVVATDRLAGRAAVWIAEQVWRAVAERGEAHVAVSGGSTPAAMLLAWAALPQPWDAVSVWQVDERVVPDGDPDRNANQLTVLPSSNVRLMPVTAGDLDAAAAAYAASLPVVLDVVHLGIGDDGHTASWAPAQPWLWHGGTGTSVTVTHPFNGHIRMTLTVDAVAAARRRMFLVSGAAKAPVVAKVLAGDHSIPAGIVGHENTVMLLDQAAAVQVVPPTTVPLQTE